MKERLSKLLSGLAKNPTPPNTVLIIGLGNPGNEYTKTRHNIGFLVIDELAKRLDARLTKKSSLQAEVAELNLGGKKVVLAKPTTYMNLSGNAVQALGSKFNVPNEQIWVIYDDIDLDFGTLRVRLDGSTGTHNGIKSVAQKLGSTSFLRLRLGVGKPDTQIALKDWVLSRFSKAEQEQLPAITSETAEFILSHIGSTPEETTKTLI